MGLVAMAPGIFWLWFFIRKDVYRPVPRRMLALAFGSAVSAPYRPHWSSTS